MWRIWFWEHSYSGYFHFFWISSCFLHAEQFPWNGHRNSVQGLIWEQYHSVDCVYHLELCIDDPDPDFYESMVNGKVGVNELVKALGLISGSRTIQSMVSAPK
jgi:hypothetical protein